MKIDSCNTIIVTGGAGFIGSNFVRFLLKNYSPKKIIILDKLTYASSELTVKDLLGDIVSLQVVDVADRKQIEPYFSPEVDLVVHFAAESFNDKSLTEPESFVTSNIIGTFNVLELCRLYGIRLHHISTDEVFGDFPLNSKDRFTETTPYNPSSPYSATKASADLLVKAWVRSFGVQATISNCSNNYGPYQNPEKFIPRQVTNILKGVKPVLYGSGLNVRDWIHVEDHCRAICLIIENGVVGETYMVGIDNERTNLEVMQKILANFNLGEFDFKFVTDRVGHDLRYGIDASKLVSELGFKPVHTDFDVALSSTIGWYKENRAWWSALEEKKGGSNG